MKANRAFKNPVVRWVDQRLPVFTMLTKEYGEFPMPRNINYWWSFGAIASVLLLVMIFSGIVLAMNYVANSQHAFESVQRIMRDVNWGWLVRYIHSNGASLFFLAVYLHMVRGIYYGSYKEPREMLWILGVAIYLIMILTAFLGYVLPWGQMSFWAATVITSLFSAIPGVGESISQWLWGGFSVGNPTLGRFYALHYLMPFVLLGLVVLHVWALHVSRSNNPTGIEPANSKDTVPFFPLVLVKDSVAMVVFAIVFTIFVFYAPEFMGHPDNNIAANPLKTPAHIVPEWYFLPFYTILRAVPDILFIPAKLAGVIALFGAIAMLFILPWLDVSKIRSCRYRPVYRVFVLLFMANFVLLGWLGAQLPEGIFLILGRVATAWYFIHFLVITPLVGKFERPVAMPTSLSAALRGLVILVAVGGMSGLVASPAKAAEETLEVPKLVWSFDGPFGTYDRDQLQRGFQVFRNVCQSCHGLDLIYFRDLKGIGYNADQIKTIAAEYSVQDGPDELGEMYDRPAIPNDRFANPFPNEALAKAANSGSIPPDLSLMALARFGGADYIYAFLNGFREAPHGFEIDENTQYYNLYFPGNIVAMPPQLENVIIEYDDGTPGTTDNYGRDVSAFLQWVADPYLEERHRMGMGVLIFLGVLLLLLIALQRKLSKKAL